MAETDSATIRELGGEILRSEKQVRL